MKKFITLFVSVFLSVSLFAQTPEKMSYQAIIRNQSNNLVLSTAVGMQISILQGSANGTAVYVVTQTSTTNTNGLVSIEIGDGTVRIGDFSTIEWGNGPFFIKTETDPNGGTSYTITGTSQLLSVPYAMHSKTADKLTGGGTETDPIFMNSEAAHITKTDINKLYRLYGENTGDQDLSFLATKIALGDSTAKVRSEIPDVSGFLSTETDPLFFSSIAAGVTGADTAFWNKKSEFSGDYIDLYNKPINVSEFANDVGYQLASDDGDVTPNNELQEIYGFENNIIITQGNQLYLPDFEGDPKFLAWDKKSGILINENQIIDLDHYTGEDITGSEAAFVGWDKNAADDFTVSDETDQVYSADSSFIKSGTRSWNSSLAKTIDASDTTYWGRVETDPFYSTDSSFIKTGTRSWNSSLAKTIDASDTTYWGRAEIDPFYSADSAFLNTGVRSWNSSPSNNITTTDISNWNDKSYISDLDSDTKIETEQSSDEDIIRMNVAGTERMQINGSTGTSLRLPTNNATSSLTVTKSSGAEVFKVDGAGRMTGDGSGLSNVKPLINYIGGNQRHQVLSNYGRYDNVRTVTLTVPANGVCMAMASGYIDWESTGWDLYLGAILMDEDPNSSWTAENHWYSYLNITTDYNCPDSSDQYTGFSQHRSFPVSAGTHTFTLWVNKYSSASKTELGDVNLTVLFIPTGGTGTPLPESPKMEDKQVVQESAGHFTSVPRSPNGENMKGLALKNRLNAMMNEEGEKNNEIEELKGAVSSLQVENNQLKLEKDQTDKRISNIEKKIEELSKKK